MRATVLVRPKHGILDPQGEAVRTALDHLGFDVSVALRVEDPVFGADEDRGLHLSTTPGSAM